MEQRVSQEELKELEKAEPWDEMDAKLVKYPLILGIIFLIIMGILTNIFLR